MCVFSLEPDLVRDSRDLEGNTPLMFLAAHVHGCRSRLATLLVDTDTCLIEPANVPSPVTDACFIEPANLPSPVTDCLSSNKDCSVPISMTSSEGFKPTLSSISLPYKLGPTDFKSSTNCKDTDVPTSISSESSSDLASITLDVISNRTYRNRRGESLNDLLRLDCNRKLVLNLKHD